MSGSTARDLRRVSGIKMRPNALSSRKIQELGFGNRGDGANRLEDGCGHGAVHAHQRRSLRPTANPPAPRGYPYNPYIYNPMRKLNYIMHISLDGYYADTSNNMQWVHMDDFIGDWVDQVISTCDTALYGRVTYQMMEGFWPTVEQLPAGKAARHITQHARWIKQAKKIVVTKTLTSTTWQNSQIIKGDVVNAIKDLKEEPGKDIVMLGSATLAQLLMSHNLIDDYWLTINPVTLGAGQHLFHQPLKLKLIEPDCRLFPNGSVGAHYRPA